MKIKVCGMREQENIAAIAALKPDYLGFIFYPKSKRYVHNIELPALPKTIKKTGVFVDASYHEIKQKIALYKLDAIQLHGSESPQFCRNLMLDGLEVIKAFGVHEDFYFYVTEPYLNAVDYFLFDTKTSEHGGSGLSFNWDILKNYPYDKPYFLSGGIGLDNIHRISQINDDRLYALDLNSKFEISPAVKDVEKLKTVFEQIRKFPAHKQDVEEK